MQEKGMQKVVGRWLPCLLLVLLFVGAKAMPEYSQDSYWMSLDVTYTAHDMLYRNGRPVIALAFWILAKLGIPFPIMYRVLFWCAIFFFSTALFLLQDFLLHRFFSEQTDTAKGYGLSLLTAFLLIFNPFVEEYFFFLECGCFGLSALLSVCAFLSLQRYFETGRKKNIGLALLLLLSALVWAMG